MNDEAKWRGAKGLSDICELMAQWIEGKISYQPGYGDDEVAEETIPLTEILANFNRKGFVTLNSQPGEQIEEGSGQRAEVSGFASEEVAKRLYKLMLDSGLLVFIYPPFVESGYHIPITIWDFHPCTWSGSSCGGEHLRFIMEATSREAIAELAETWEVIIIDPQWGRNDLLWERVTEALDSETNSSPYQTTPHLSLELEYDFYY